MKTLRLLIAACIVVCVLHGAQGYAYGDQQASGDQQSPTVQTSTVGAPSQAAAKGNATTDPDKKPKGFIERFLKRWDDPLVLFTLVLSIVGLVQAWTYCGTLEAIKVVERAYIGLDRIELTNFAPNQNPRIVLVCLNHGKTPAEITDVICNFRMWTSVPPLPSYVREDHRPTPRLVVNSGQPFRWLIDYPEQEFTVSPKTYEHMNDGRADTPKLYIFGYFEYLDRFKVRHRAGFGRRWITAPQAGFVNMHEPGYEYAD